MQPGERPAPSSRRSRRRINHTLDAFSSCSCNVAALPDLLPSVTSQRVHFCSALLAGDGGTSILQDHILGLQGVGLAAALEAVDLVTGSAGHMFPPLADCLPLVHRPSGGVGVSSKGFADAATASATAKFSSQELTPPRGKRDPQIGSQGDGCIQISPFLAT